MSDVLELERTAEDRARTVRHILADLRAHEVAGVTAAEIREAIEIEEEETEMDRDPVTLGGRGAHGVGADCVDGFMVSWRDLGTPYIPYKAAPLSEVPEPLFEVSAEYKPSNYLGVS